MSGRNGPGDSAVPLNAWDRSRVDRGLAAFFLRRANVYWGRAYVLKTSGRPCVHQHYIRVPPPYPDRHGVGVCARFHIQSSGYLAMLAVLIIFCILPTTIKKRTSNCLFYTHTKNTLYFYIHLIKPWHSTLCKKPFDTLLEFVHWNDSVLWSYCLFLTM